MGPIYAFVNEKKSASDSSSTGSSNHSPFYQPARQGGNKFPGNCCLERITFSHALREGKHIFGGDNCFQGWVKHS